MRYAYCLVIGVLFSACCDKTLPEVPSFWLRVLEYQIPAVSGLDRVARGVSEPIGLLDTEGFSEGRAATENLEIWVQPQRYGFWLDLTNTSDEPMVLLWPEARYLDEKGQAHEVYAQQRGALPDDRDELTTSERERLVPGERTRPTVVPLYKQYMVRYGCRGRIAYSEPLVPTNLREMTEEQTKTYVDRMAREEIPVKFLLPVEIGGERYDYVFSFVLRDWREGLPEATPEEIEKLEELDKLMDEMERNDWNLPPPESVEP